MLDKEEIKKIIPQREPFLMIDEVEQFVPGESCTAYKNVNEDEYYFKGHFPGNPIMPGVLMVEALAQTGAVAILSMEENRADRKLIKNMKTGLFGSFAGIGDAIFWFTLLPISGSIAASLCKQHSILGPIFFLAFWILMAVSRVFFLKAGYKLGSGAISKLTENAKALTKGAGILGVMVVGAMVPSYVTFEFPEKLKLFGTVGVQSIFDSVIPNLLPALFVGILYYIFKKKKVSIVVLILAIIAFAILMSFLGWL